MINFTTCANVANSFLKVLQGYTKGIRFIALLTILCTIGVGQMWGAETIIYTLDGNTTGGSNSYADASDITQNNVSWSVVGNTTMSPWRIGGKSLTNTDRTIASTTSIASNISKVVVSHGTASSVTVNSLKLIVASDASFSNVVSTVTGEFTASKTTTFTCPNNADWTNMYYKFVYNITISGTSNKYLQFNSATFYGEESQTGGGSTPEPEPDPEPGDADAYKLITSTAELEAGAKYVIGNALSSSAVFMSNATNTNNRKQTASITITDSQISATDEVLVLELGGTTGAWTFLTTNYTSTNGYLTSAATGSNNYCKVVAPAESCSYFTISFTNNAAVITSTGRTERNVLRYNSSSSIFACYTSGQNPVYLYKLVEAGTPEKPAAPAFTVAGGSYYGTQSIEITCATAGANIYYTLDGSVPTSSSTPYTGAISISETKTLKAIAIKGENSSSVTEATYTILAPLATMQEIFDKATAVGGTATPVKVTMNNWVVTGVKNSNAYVTDGTKGFIIYTASHGFLAGDILSGTVSCKVQLYKGSAELTELTSTTTGLTVSKGGEVTPIELDEEGIATLAGINTGSVIKINGTCSQGNIISDIRLYNTLYSFEDLTVGAKYDVTGVYLLFESTKEILPRGAEDIVKTQDLLTATISIANISLEIEKQATIEATITPDAAKNTVTYTIKSGDEYITLNGTTITAKAVGEATITATIPESIGNYSGTTKDFTVTVTPKNIAVLPFAFNSGKEDIEGTLGMSQNGLGSDYGSAPLLKFDGTDDYVIIHFDSEPGMLSYDIKGNSYSGGTFTVQESADGSAYTNIVEYTELGSTETKTHTLAATSRYVKFIYTEKVNGNVALGNVEISKPDNRAEADLAWTPETVTLTVGEDFTPPTLSNPNGLTLTCTSNNEDLVTVTNAGVITLKESVTGTATITASFAGNGDYKPAEVSCTITVKAALVKPNWQPATITFEGIIQVACGSTTVLNPADPNNGPATITFNGYDLVNPVTVTASDGFLVSTDKTTNDKYTTTLTVNPHKEGENIGKLQNVYVIAQAPAQSGDFTGTITLTGADITGGSQVINVTADVTCTTYTITWSVDGDTELIPPTTFYAGGEWELPENPTYECNGREFVGWTNTEIVQPQDIAPNVLYKGDFPTIESDITFYAVFAQEGTGDGSGTATVTDVLNREWTEVSGTTYKDWNEKTATSSAVYAGNSAGGNEYIQLRSDASKDAAGIITTTSGGKATNITVVWNNQTAAGRTLNVYGKNSAYSAVADLRNEDTRGTLLGTIVNGTSTSLTINNDYEYIGLCSNSGAMYLTSIAITWATDGEGDGNATTYTSYTTSCADVTAIRIVEPTTKTFNEGDKLVFDGEVWAINSDGTETNVTNSSYVSFTCDMNKVGTQTVTVSYLGFTATYEITINEVEKWQITWNVSGATNTGLGPKEVAKGTAIDKLPNPKIPDGCDEKTFVGWTESNTVNSDGTEITFITSSTVPTQNTTYYAVFATSSGKPGDGDYVKLTETPADLSGEYLIVYEDSKGSPAAPKAFNGGLGTLDAASNTISVTIDGNTIKSTDATDAAKFTITKNGDAYIITSASNYHIGQTSDANGLLSSKSTSYTNTITITEGNADIIGSGGAYLRYNKVSALDQGQQTGLRFRYYKSGTYTGQQPIALYKKSGSSASYTDYTTGCHNVTITYYGFTGGYTTNCDGSDLNVITTRVNSAHTIPSCADITDPTTLGRKFLNLWKDQNGKVHQPGETFIVTENITLYAQWKLETTGDIELPADKEDLATTDIVVTGGKTLTIPEGKTITINSLTLKGGLQENGTYAMPVVNIPTGAALVRNNNKINLDLKVNNKSYYPFAVPFEVANTSDNVNYINPTLKAYVNAINGYGTYYRILEYNGALRAENGVNSAENWVQVGRTGVKLMPGKGYAISAVPASGQDTVTIRITMNVDNAWLANGEQESITVKEQTTTRNQIAVTAHTGAASDINKGGHQRHAGWNFVANPYLTNFTANENISGAGYINGEIIINNGEYSYGGEKVPYVTIPTYNFAHYYQVKLSKATLSPTYGFFVQVGTDGTMSFAVAGRQTAPASIAARNAEERPVKMDVDITLSDNHSSDQTGIIISDRYSDAYEIGRDLEKLFGSAYNLSVYTLMADNTPLAFQALAIRSNMQVIPVGYRTPAQGEYTFRLNEATSSIDLLNEQYEQLVLVDYQTGELTNLLISDYTFYSERVQSDSRFALYAVPRQNAPTDLPNAIGQDKQAQKIIHNGHLYILRDGNVYNGNGQIVK